MNVDKVYNQVLWFQELEKTTNKTFMPLYACNTRNLVLMGGAGSGKSIFAGRKILERITSEKGHTIIIARKFANTLKNSCFAQIKGQISDHYIYRDFKINESEMSIRYKNGSRLVFTGLDDAEKLKSIYKPTGAWIEEASEVSKEDYLQINTRIRELEVDNQQIIITFNPISATHWLKAFFFDTKKSNTVTHRSTYKDNRFLPQSYIDELEGYKDTDEYYYNVYALGMWGVYGKTVFNAEKVTQRLTEVKEPMKIGSFLYDYDGLNIFEARFSDDVNGFISIYKDVEQGVPYVIGGDTAGDGEDSFACQVIDNLTGEQVAVLHMQSDEDLFTKQVYCLGKYYNEALISLEANFSTYPIMELDRLGYTKQYIRQQADNYTGRMTKSFGFKTTSATRPIIIANLVEIVRDSVDLMNDKRTLEEMLTFVRNAKGRAEAQQGAHDDLIMSLAIAYFSREQQTSHMEAVQIPWAKEISDNSGIGEKIVVI